MSSSCVSFYAPAGSSEIGVSAWAPCRNPPPSFARARRRTMGGCRLNTMKKLAGTTLAVIVHGPDREQFGRQRLLRAFVEVCLAVEFAHVLRVEVESAGSD